jgi:hypothetical protein
MTGPWALGALAAVAIAVAGCSSYGVSEIMGEDTPSVAGAQSGQNLAMPPDLRLPPPGSAPAAPPPRTVAAAARAPDTANPSQPQGDVFAQNGISRYHPDGTAKTPGELHKELQDVYIAKKRQKNPNYGTVFNIGNIFKDE